VSASSKRRPSPREGDAARERELIDELRALYREVDALHAGWSCPASTDCCHFGRTGREPYVTSIELALVERARAKVSAGQRSGGRRLPVADRRCAMLTEEGRCSIYAERPFGCRTFFCDKAEPGERIKHARIQELVTRLKTIAAKHVPGGDAGRPFSRCLA
jgi:Fe-S-cluster containining protein